MRSDLDRACLLQAWLASTLASAVPSVETEEGTGYRSGRTGRELSMELLAGDASLRRYYRVTVGSETLVVMDAPPPHEDVTAFCDIAGRLRRAGLHAPRVLAKESEHGFLVLEDLGDELYLTALDPQSADRLYGDAIHALAQMQRRTCVTGLPVYGPALLIAEMRLFAEWFVERHLGQCLSTAEAHVLQDSFAVLSAAARAQPHRFVHRDYHSRNLLVGPRGKPGILDFQDAVHGPVSYDLVSLLRDVYIQWPAERVSRWVGDYVERAVEMGIFGVAESRGFGRWFDLMGVQRHLKIAGIFARLNHRDGKPGYLADIPLTLAYLEEVLARYRELDGLKRLIHRLVCCLAESTGPCVP